MQGARSKKQRLLLDAYSYPRTLPMHPATMRWFFICRHQQHISSLSHEPGMTGSLVKGQRGCALHSGGTEFPLASVGGEDPDSKATTNDLS